MAIGTLQFQARLSQALLAPTRPEASPAALDLIPVRRNLAVTPSKPSSLKKLCALRAPLLRSRDYVDLDFVVRGPPPDGASAYLTTRRVDPFRLVQFLFFAGAA